MRFPSLRRISRPAIETPFDRENCLSVICITAQKCLLWFIKRRTTQRLRRRLIVKTVFTAAFLTFGVSFGATLTPASADTLSSLQSACRTGVYSACSQYNAAIIARSSAKNPVLTYGFDPFAIQPASHTERTPKAPKPTNKANQAKPVAQVTTAAQ